MLDAKHAQDVLTNLVNILPLHATQHRPKDFLCDNAHVILDITKQGWLNKQTFVTFPFACMPNPTSASAVSRRGFRSFRQASSAMSTQQLI